MLVGFLMQKEINGMCGEDLISKRAAIYALGYAPMVCRRDDKYALGAKDQYDKSKRAIEALPSIQPERKIGRWIDDCTCSNCLWTHTDSNGFALITDYDYCPKCGAIMKNGK